MMKTLDRYADHAYALLRIVSGGLFLFHGAEKLFGVFGASQPAFGSQLWFAGVIEFFGGAAIMVGFGTRVAAFLASGEMAVAYFQVHWKLQMDPAHVFPIMNKGELAMLYCFLFLYIALKGAGNWSLNKKI